MLEGEVDAQGRFARLEAEGCRVPGSRQGKWLRESPPRPTAGVSSGALLGARDDTMSFWDSSALVPLLVEEASTASLTRMADEDREMIAWWGSTVECASALARLERSGALQAEAARQAFARLDALSKSWYEIEPVSLLKETATRFLRVHDLRAADALQLAAAFVAAEGRPPSLRVICLDHRLAVAAQREGFDVLDEARIGALYSS